jgi:hypothetical protein
VRLGADLHRSHVSETSTTGVKKTGAGEPPRLKRGAGKNQTEGSSGEAP